MNAIDPFARAAFIPECTDLSAFREHSVGLTGARGLLGSILMARLERQGITVAAYPGDINDEATVAAWFEQQRCSHFFHFAAMVPVGLVEGNPLLAFQTNVIGAFNICKHLLRTQPHCWLFHCSSSHVYQPTARPTPIAEDSPTHPPTFYGATKLAAERVIDTLLAKLQAPYCIGRVFSFTHARQAVPYLVPSLRQKIAALPVGTTLELDNPSAVRDIQDAEQVIDVILQLARRTVTGTVNIGTGIGSSVGDIARSLALALGRTLSVAGVDRGAPGALVADTTRLRALLAAVETAGGR